MAKYYCEDELVWHKPTNSVVKVLSINTKNLTMKVESMSRANVFNDNLWHFGKSSIDNDTIIVQSRVRPSAKLLKKDKREDAGYDVWLDIPRDFTYELNGETKKAWSDDNVLEIILSPHKVYTLPTGIRVATSQDYWLDFKYERGSTGKYGLSILSGVVDSGYRGEVFLNIVNVQDKDLVITNKTDKIIETDDYILFPYSKAVAQAVLQRNYHTEVVEIPEDEFLQLKSQRGEKALGSTDK